MIEPIDRTNLTIDRQPGMVHIKRPDGKCVACVEAAAFEYIRQALMAEFLAAAERVAGGPQPEGPAPWAR